MKNNNNWLLIYSTSPVQSFITSSRKTRDFFLGSYILSYITYSLLTFTKNQWPFNIEIIYPVLEEQGIYRANKGETVTLHDLLVANFPNKMVLLLKNLDFVEVKEIRNKILQKFEEIKNKLFEASYEEVITQLCKKFQKNQQGNSKKITEENLSRLCEFTEQDKLHFLNYFQPFLIIKKIKGSLSTDYGFEYNYTEHLLGLRKTYRRYDGKEDGFKTFKLKNNQLEEYYPNGCTVCGERLHLVLNTEPLAETTDIDENERLCGVCLTKRYSGYFFGNSFKEQSNLHLADIDKQVLNFLAEITAKVWNNPRDWVIPFTRFPSTHEVALSREKFLFIDFLIQNPDFIGNEDVKTLKKLFKNFPESFTYALNPIYINKLWKKIEEQIPNEDKKEILKYLIFLHADFLSTEYLGNLQKSLDKELQKLEKFLDKEDSKETSENIMQNIINKKNVLENFTGLIKKLFQQIKTDKGIDFEALFNTPPYFTIIFSDGDNIGKILGGDKNLIKEDFTKDFHYTFSAQLSRYANEVSQKAEKGFSKVIYAGGDDLYTFSHLSDITRILTYSSELYKCNLLDLLKNPSTSAGVVIGHAKVNLKFLTRKVHEAEKEAKNNFGRNAFVIKVISRSGDESSFGSKFSYGKLPSEHQPLKVLEKLIELYGGYISQNPSWKDLQQPKEVKLSSRLPYSLRELANQFPGKADIKKRKEETEEEYKERIKLESRNQEGFILALLKREIKRKIQAKEQEKEKLTKEVFEMLSNLLRVQVEKHLMLPSDALRNIASLLYIARFIAQGGKI